MNEIERIELLEAQIRELKQKIISYSFSEIKLRDLKELVDIRQNIKERDKFDSWFNNSIVINQDIEEFLIKLVEENIDLISSYTEEDLKMYVLSPLLNHINFKLLDINLRGFYDEVITYKSDNFIFTGKTDFLFAKGFKISQKPYFFIQEFKKGIKGSNPEPQLLAELISAVELNRETAIKGAYIVGENWNFVILEKLGENKYQYFISRTFNSTNIEDFKMIYTNLLFIKNEVIEIVKNEM